MKRIGLILLLVALGLMLSGCSDSAARFVEFPLQLQDAIVAVFVFAVGWLFAQIGARWPWFVKAFGQYADEIAITIAGALIGVIQNALNMIPPEWEAVGNAAMVLIVAVLAAIGLFRTLGKAQVRSFR